MLVTISDKKIGHTTGGTTIDYYNADVATANDYYSFGMGMPGRKFVQGNNKYRYGFNGKENDNDVKGDGNQQDYGMRIYDPRLGRFLSVDPITKKYLELTPYQFASNTPIWGTDLDGLEVRIYTESTGLTGHAFLTVGVDKNLILYSYGRYAGVLPTLGVTSGKLSPTGPGVLLRLTGKSALKFIKEELIKNKANAFEIKDAVDRKVIANMDNLFNSSSEIPTVESYKNIKDAHIIDKYNIVTNSCVTKTINGVKAGGTKEDFVDKNSVGSEEGGSIISPPVPISPKELESFLIERTSTNCAKVKNVTNLVKIELGLPSVPNVNLPIPTTDHPEDNQAKKNTIPQTIIKNE